MDAIATDRPDGRGYTAGEELANTITSGVGTMLAIAGLAIMLAYALLDGDVWQLAGVSVFGATLITSHLMSTLYHGMTKTRVKRAFRLFDHLAIYLLIAGTYTPFTLVNLRGPWGWSLFALIWTLAIAGVVIKITRLDDWRYLSTLFYVAMGWAVILVIKPLLDHVAVGGVCLLLAGGIFYTLGVLFYAWHRIPYNHAIWHIFVIGGGIFHFFAVLFYVILLVPAGAVS